MKNRARQTVLPLLAGLAIVGSASAQAAAPTTVSASGGGAGSLPEGAVVAFYTACPSGWAKYANADGRVIVGAGTGYALGSTGGAAQVTLTVAQMPKHQHGQGMATQTMAVPFYGTSNKGSSVYNPTSRSSGKDMRSYPAPNTSFEGGSQPFDNRQPYIALNYCYKL